MMGMKSGEKRAISVNDILALLVEEIKAILRTEKVSTSAQLVTMGMDSLGFVRTHTGDSRSIRCDRL